MEEAMTVYENPLLRRRSPLQVAAWMAALCAVNGQMNGAELWLMQLLTEVVEEKGVTP